MAATITLRSENDVRLSAFRRVEANQPDARVVQIEHCVGWFRGTGGECDV